MRNESNATGIGVPARLRTTPLALTACLVALTAWGCSAGPETRNVEREWSVGPHSPPVLLDQDSGQVEDSLAQHLKRGRSIELNGVFLGNLPAAEFAGSLALDSATGEVIGIPEDQSKSAIPGQIGGRVLVDPEGRIRCEHCGYFFSSPGCGRGVESLTDAELDAALESLGLTPTGARRDQLRASLATDLEYLRRQTPDQLRDELEGSPVDQG